MMFGTLIFFFFSSKVTVLLEWTGRQVVCMSVSCLFVWLFFLLPLSSLEGVTTDVSVLVMDLMCQLALFCAPISFNFIDLVLL